MDIGASFRITAGVAGQAAVDKLNAGVGQLNTGIGKLPGIAKTAGLAMAGLGAGIGVAVLKEKFDGVVESIMKVKDAAEKTGSSVEKIGGLVQAAKITGDDWGTIEGAIIKMDKALAGADDTAKGAARALEAIGLKMADLKGMDPADAFSKIATAMSGFGDSAGKTAVAMDIFGKNGAQVLPFLKDYAEIGEQVSKVTKQQTEDAEAYERAINRLNAGKQELYKTISTQVLPVATDFTKALLDVTNGTNGVREGAKALAADGTLQSIFREAARAGAAFLDIVSLIIGALRQIKESAGAVLADLSVVASGMNLLNPMKQWNDLQSGKSMLADFKATLAERNRIVEEANKNLQERWDSSKTPYTDALEKQFAKRDADAKNPPKPEQKKSLQTYTSRAPTDGKGSTADPFQTEMNSLGRDASKLQFQIDHIKQFGDALDSSRAAQVRFDIEQGKFKDLSEKNKTMLLMQAEAVDQLANRLAIVKAAMEFDKQTAAIDQNTASLGMNTRERELAAFAQDMENKGIHAGTEEYIRLMNARKAALSRKDAAENDPMTGLVGGLKAVADQAKGTGTIIHDSLVSAFDKAGDAFADFVTTGKFNFKSFAASVIGDLAKMIAKQAVFNALKAGMSFFGFADGGAFGSGGQQMFASGGVVNSPTPFRFASGGTMKNGLMGEAGPEAIMPLKRGPDGKLGVTMSGGQQGGGVTIGSIVVNNNGDASANDPQGKNSAALGRSLSAAVQAEILRQKRPGGLLAA